MLSARDPWGARSCSRQAASLGGTRSSLGGIRPATATGATNAHQITPRLAGNASTKKVPSQSKRAHGIGRPCGRASRRSRLR